MSSHSNRLNDRSVPKPATDGNAATDQKHSTAPGAFAERLTRDVGGVPKQGRLAAIDFGTVRIGLAVCDPSQTWVTPLDTYARRNERLDAQYFERLAQREEIVGWIIGLPIHCDGKESQKSGEARAFADWLMLITPVPIAFYDERFTTAEARRLLSETDLSPQKRKAKLDRLAAHLILTHYLDSTRNTSSGSLDANASSRLDDEPRVPKPG